MTYYLRKLLLNLLGLSSTVFKHLFSGKIKARLFEELKNTTVSLDFKYDASSIR